MPQRPVVALASLTLVLMAAISGCRGGTDKFLKNRPATVKAEGTVTYKGKPVVGATIVFAPDDGKHAAAAVTDSYGQFKLSTFPPKPGAVPGSYKVTISAVESVEMPVLPEGVHAEDLKLPPPKLLVPAKYNDVKTSGLTASIPKEGRTDLNFELTD